MPHVIRMALSRLLEIFYIYNDSESGGSNPSKDPLCERNIGQEMWCRKAESTGLRTIRTA
jgi:hypothetical protein